MRLPSFENITNAIKSSLNRFPLALLFAFVCCFLAMYLIENEPGTESIPFRILVSLGIGFPLMIGLQIASEQFPEKPGYRWLFYLGGILLVIAYYFFLSPDFSMEEIIRPVRFISVLIIVHLFVSIAPYIKGGDVNDFWEFNKTIFLQWFIGALYGIIIYGGLCVAILATDQLFDININEKLYAHLYFIILLIFHPLYYTANFPKEFHGTSQEKNDTKSIKNLVLYILIPLSMLYFFILYAYGIKIVFNWNLPKGWVSSLVIGFSIAGTLTYLLNYRLPDVTDNALIKWFRKWYFFVLFPLVILLYIAIFTRINEYGFTPERYFVLLTGIWLTILSGYFIISKRDNIKWIPASLMIFLLIGTYSPIDAFHISSNSQLKSLKEFLATKSMIKNDMIVANPGKLNSEDSYKVNTILKVLEEMQSLDKVNQNLLKPVVPDSTGKISIGKIMSSIGGDSLYYNDPAQYLNYNSETEQKIKLEGYSEMIPINVYKGGIYEDGLQIKENEEVLLIKEDGKVIDEFSVRTMLLSLELRHGKQKSRMPLDQCSFDFNSKLYNVRLIFTQLSIEKKGNKFDISSMNGFLLVKSKK